ncbi:TfoX/Sxy family protein [Cellulomonas hominis]
MAFDEVLAQRVRDVLRDAPDVSEKRMFSGVSFLSSGLLTVGVSGDDLMVRVGAAAVPAALEREGAEQFMNGARPMTGWLRVAGEVLDDEELLSWVVQARTYVRSLPPRGGRA